ncbi:MAG: hypothetical protein JXQ96_17465 [Cyclobacteriaceae bacterium]
MNKTAKIIIGIMSVALVFLLVYARTMANEAEKKGTEAKMNLMKALKAQKMAEEQAKIAEQRAAEAIMTHHKAQEAMLKLEECQNSK